MARQAHCLRAILHVANRSDWRFSAAYSPYFDRGTIHQRSIRRRSDGTWLVRDHVEAQTADAVEGALHFHPDVDVRIQGETLECRRDKHRLLVQGIGLGPWELSRGATNPVSGWFFPAFGVAEKALTVRYKMNGPDGGFDLRPLDAA